MYASVFRPDTHGFIKDMLLGGNEGTAPNAKAVATANGATSGLNVPADKKKVKAFLRYVLLIWMYRSSSSTWCGVCRMCG